MKTIFRLFSLCWVLLIAISLQVWAQTAPERPYSFTHKLKKKVPLVSLKVNKENLEKNKAIHYEKSDRERDFEIGTPYVGFGFMQENKTYTMADGVWEDLANGDRVWRMTFHVKTAKGVGVVMKKVKMSDGCKLFFYDKKQKYYVGSVDRTTRTTNYRNEGDEIYFGGLPGDRLYIEYYEPKHLRGQSHFEIQTVMYRWSDFPYSFTQQLSKTVPVLASGITNEKVEKARSRPVLGYSDDDVFRDVNWSFDDGVWDTLPDGGRVWRLHISGTGLKDIEATEVYIDKFTMPKGAKLYYYDPKKMCVSPLIFAFKRYNFFVPGTDIILEYYEPKDIIGKSKIHIKSIHHYYLRPGSPKAGIDCTPSTESAFTEGKNCNAEVRCGCDYGINPNYSPLIANCPGLDTLCSTAINQALINKAKHAVMRIKLIAPDGHSYSNCTGTLINNSQNRFFVLTANHCFKENPVWHYAVGDTVKWEFWFNEERRINPATDSCSITALPNQTNFVEGGIVRAASGVTATNGTARSDFALIELLSPPTPVDDFMPYYAGWDATKNIPNDLKGLGIHHPGGSPKKVAIQDDDLNCGCPQNNGIKPYQYATSQIFQKSIVTNNNGDHFAVTYDRGNTRSGSSGSPYLGIDTLVRGQLHGSPDYDCCAYVDEPAHEFGIAGGYLDNDCNPSSTLIKTYKNGNTERYSEYGRLWYSWTKGAYNVDNIDNISSEDTIKSTLKYWLDPYNTEPDTVMAGLSPTNCDIFFKDGWCDDGQEPNLNCQMPGGWDDIWASPDLWNVVVNTTYPEDSVWVSNQNQEIEMHDGFDDFYNYLRFRIRNYNSNCTSKPASLHFYWTMASTGEMWPNSWINHFDTDGSCPLGGEITLLSNTDGSIISDPFPIPPIAPGGEFSGYNRWFPPNYTDLNADQDMYPYQPFTTCDGLTVDDTLANPKFEICYLARLVSLDDPIKGESNAPISDNVLNSNNIITHNSFIADPIIIGMPPYIPSSGSIGGQVISAGQPSIILMANNNNVSKDLNLKLESLLDIGDYTAIADLVQIEIITNAELWDRWISSGAKGEGIQIISERTIKITDLSVAKMLDIPFDPYQKEPIAIKVTLITTTGKADNVAPIPDTFRFRITHEAYHPNETINQASSCFFSVNNLQKYRQFAPQPSASDQDFDFVVRPNPFSTWINISFVLLEESMINLNLYDTFGRLQKTVVHNTFLPSGYNQYQVGTSELPKGMYIAELKTNSGKVSRKIIKID
jgi:hypothetical protein